MEKELISKIRPGARVRVWERIKDGDKERQSAFEGLVLAHKHGSEAGATFTVRTVLSEVGVEKVFPIHSPTIASVEILATPKKVHKSKLYYVRDFSSKKTRERLVASKKK
jgi:large subunit ribosomal protein L19